MISSPSRTVTRVAVTRLTALLAAFTAPLLVLGLLVAGPATAAVATGDRAGSSTSSQTAAGDRSADERDRKKAEKERAKAQKAAAKAEKREQKAAEREQKAAAKAEEQDQKAAAKAKKREQKAAAKVEKREQKAAEREQKAAAKAKAAEREQKPADEDDVVGSAAEDSPSASPTPEPADGAQVPTSMSAAGSTELQRSSVVLASRRAGCVDGLAVLQGQCSLTSSLDTNAGPQPSGQAQPPAAAVRKPAAAPQAEPRQAQGWSRVTTGVTDLASALPQTGAAAWLTYGAAAGALLLVGGFVLIRRRSHS